MVETAARRKIHYAGRVIKKPVCSSKENKPACSHCNLYCGSFVHGTPDQFRFKALPVKRHHGLLFQCIVRRPGIIPSLMKPAADLIHLSLLRIHFLCGSRKGFFNKIFGNAALLQIMADTLGKNMELIPAIIDPTALGAWINTSVCLKDYANAKEAYQKAVTDDEVIRYQPDYDNYAVYKGKRLQMKEIYNRLYGKERG